MTDDFLSVLSALHRGTSYPAVRDGDVREQPIPLAPTAEQHRIVAKIEELFMRLDAGVAASKRAQANLKRYKGAVLAANLARAGRLRQSILKRAFVGQLVPQDLSDEPASVLLERIRTSRQDAKPQRRH